MNRGHLLASLCGLFLFTACLNVKAPERIEVHGGGSYEDTGPAEIPPTSTHEEARAELQKAYDRIALLKRENSRLHRKIDDLEEDLDKAKDERDEYKDRAKRHRDDD